MSSPTITPATLPPMLFPDDAPRVRSTDPLTSSAAADTSVSRETVALWVEAALESEGRPMTADAIALLPGWELSRGANLELHIADQLGMPVKAWQTWLCDTGTAAEPCPGCPDCSGVHNSIPEES